MSSTSPLSSVVPVIALGAALALQPLSPHLLSATLSPAQAFAGGLTGSRSGGAGGSVGGSLGGSVGASLGTSLGSAVGSASGAMGGAAGIGVGASASATGAAAGAAGAALNGATDALASGIAATDVGAAVSAEAGGAAGSDHQGGLGLLGAIGTLLKGGQGGAQASARLAARYEHAMLQGDVPGAAQCLREMMPSQISTAAVDALNARLSIDASARFVAALVQEARLQQQDEDASHHAGRVHTRKTHHGSHSQDDAEAYGKALLSGDVHAAAERYLRLEGRAASVAQVRALNQGLGLSVDESTCAKVAAETRLLARAQADADVSASASLSATTEGQDRPGLSTR